MAPNNGYHAGGRAKGDELNKIERRRREVAHLITVHYTYREMAERLGVASSTISEDVKVIRERWRDRATADYGSHLAEELAKLDLLEHELLPTALSGGPKGGVNLRAVDRVLAIRDRRARMLGLDSPSRLEVTMRVEQVAKAIELVVVEMGLDPDTVRPILGAKLRELRHLRELAPGSCSAKSRPLRPAVSLVRRPGREGSLARRFGERLADIGVDLLAERRAPTWCSVALESIDAYEVLAQA